MKKIITALFVATMLLSACKSSKEVTGNAVETVKEVARVESWIIGSKKTSCNDGTDATCFQVKKAGESEYVPMNVVIENFNYEPGYKYQIQLKVVPSKKAETTYVFVKEVFKVASK